MVAALYAEQLASLSLKLQEINRARELLLSQIADLEEASRTVQHEYNNTFNKASAIATLPNEIISSIFEETHGLELLVSQVTPRWRDVALNTPKLWANVYVDASEEKAANLGALYLTRLKGLPFAITIVNSSEESKHVALFGRLLTEHIAHCRHVKISRNCDILIDILIPISAPLLETFDVSSSYHPQEDSFQLADIFRGGAPVLAVVRLTAMPLCLPPLGSVTTLRLLNLWHDSHMTGDRWREILVSLTRLTSLEVEGDFMRNCMRGPTVTLSALRILRICAPD